MLRKDGRDAAALSMAMEGMPPAWNTYVTVDSADDAAAKAAELGATIVSQLFDVLEAGRMAVIQDPTGAFFCVWEPRDHIGAGIVNGPGALTLSQLNTGDPERALEFYSGLFGWRGESVGEDPMPYWGLYNGPAAGRRHDAACLRKWARRRTGSTTSASRTSMTPLVAWVSWAADDDPPHRGPRRSVPRGAGSPGGGLRALLGRYDDQALPPQVPPRLAATGTYAGRALKTGWR